MNLRFWGGWFLAIACVCIFLTMGCENGSLGAKYATVCGRLVNKDNVAMGVANATVRMVSKEAIGGGGDLEQGYNFLATVTDAEGYFVFEKVQPDNVLFEFTAPGYKKVIFPSTSSEDSSGDDSSSSGSSNSETLDIESVSILNGSTINLANILMEKVSITLPSEINVKLEFVDANTKKRVDDNTFFSVSFDGVSYTKKAKAWRESGVSNILGANEIGISIRNDDEPVLYNPASMTISGISDQFISVEVEPVTYSLAFQFLNIPDYILESTNNKPIITFLVEDISTTPATNISINKVTDFSQLAVLDVAKIRNPQQIRIRMNGYRDEVITLSDELILGEKGSYRIDVDFSFNDGHVDEDAVRVSEFDGRIGMADNVITGTIEVNIFGLHQNDKASIVPNFVPGSIDWSQPFGEYGLANENGEVTAYLNNSPSYFDMTYTVKVVPQDVSIATPTYTISSPKPISIGVPNNGSIPLVVIDASNKNSSSSSSGGSSGE